MDTNVFLIILLATIMHAVWNGMVKKHPDKVVAVSGIVFGHVPASIIAIILLPAPSSRLYSLYNCKCINSSRLQLVFIVLL